MNLDLTEFQELLRQSAREVVEREFPIARHRELIESGRSFDPDLWQEVAALGWQGLMVAEEYGGGGAGWSDLVVLLEEMGRGLAPHAFPAHFLAGVLISDVGDDRQRHELLPALAQGRRVAAVALAEARGTFDAAGVRCVATRDGSGYRLDGVKHFVRGGQGSDLMLVVAGLGDGYGVFAVEPSAVGMTVEGLRTTGGDDLAKVTLQGVRCAGEALLGGGPVPAGAVERIAALGALIECGYAVGIMVRDTEMTIDYVKERVQFGRPIGAFQAVKHQVADQVTDVDCARLLTHYAAWAVDRGRPEASAEVSRAKAWVSDALRRVARTGNQLHGGIGFALEYDIHFFFERAKSSELLFGAADEHRERVAAALLDG